MTGIKKEIFNFKKGNQNSISSMYNLRCDPDHGVDENDIRRIIYVCNSCIKQLALPWDKNEKDCNHKRYGMNKSGMYWNIFESLNDWNIITLATTSKNSTEKDYEAFGTISRRVESRIIRKILTTMHCTMRIDGENTDEHYIVQWTSEPQTLQEDKEMKGCIPLVIDYVGQIVCGVVFLNPVLNAKYWSTPMNKGNGEITVQLKQALLPNMILMKLDKNKNCQRGATKSK